MDQQIRDLKEEARLEFFRKRVFDKLEAKGIEQVRYEFAQTMDRSTDKAQLTREWIGIKTREEADARDRAVQQSEREKLADANNVESLRIARASLRASQSATKAAWAAASLAFVAIVWTAFAYFFPRDEISSHALAPSARSGAQAGEQRDAKAPGTAPKRQGSAAPR
jgi:hypothetical protein